MVIDHARSMLAAQFGQAALDLANRGWPVFPVHTVRKGQCSCGKPECRNVGKHPMTEHGLKDATIDPATIDGWGAKCPDANVGLATGQGSRLVVLDVDPGHGGDESLRDLVARIGTLPDTVEVKTGGGGRHLYFAHPCNGLKIRTIVELAGLPGLDIRGDGGYVVAPPSQHVSGSRYEWEASSHPDDVALAQMPVGLLALILANEGHSHKGAASVGGMIAERLRNTTLTRMAGALRHQGANQQAIEAALISINATQSTPLLPEEEVRSIARSVARYRPAELPAAELPGQPIEWPKPLAPAGYYGLAGDITKAIAPVTEADPVAVLAHLLAAFGNAVGDAPHALVQHDKHPARVFLVLVGATSKGRKGTSWSEPRAIMTYAAPDWTPRIRQGGLSSGEGLIFQVRDAVTKLEPIKEKGKPTGQLQEVLVDPGVEDKRLFVLEPEIAQGLAVMRREGNILSPIIRQCWDSGDLAPMVKNNPTVASGAHVSIVGHVTKTELLARLDETTQANGFANRFIWLAVRRANILPNGGGLDEDDITRWGAGIAEAIEFAKGVGRVRRDSEAEALWAEIYGPLSEDMPGMIGAILGRAEAQVLRLSLIYALLDHSDVICVPHLKAALALWDYSVESARWIFGDALGDPVADRLLAALKASPDGLDGTQVRDLFQRHVSAGRMSQAVEMLTSRGLLTIRQHEDTGGRPRTLYLYSGATKATEATKGFTRGS